MTPEMVKTLLTEHFTRHPVWTWDESMDWHIPVPECRLLPTDADVFVQAKLTAADGTELSGYVVGTHSAFALTIFVGDKAFDLNVNLPQMANAEVRRLQKALRNPKLRLFPLVFSTGFSYGDGRAFDGVIDL